MGTKRKESLLKDQDTEPAEPNHRTTLNNTRGSTLSLHGRAILGLKERNRHTMSRSTHNLSLMELRVPVATVLESLVLLQQPDHYSFTHS